jgi:dTDP-glucose 4,6-dehydratase
VTPIVRKLLITGGAGFVGANFVHHWLGGHAEDRVVVLDALTYAGHRASLAAAEKDRRFRFVEGDIRDTDAVTSLLHEEAIDTIVHLAAESHVDRSIEGPDAFVDVNVAGTHSLLKAARSVWLPEGAAKTTSWRFHHVSTDEVFGSLEPDEAPFTETSLYRPSSPYSATKAASDHLVRAYHETYGLPVTMSNCSNNYGPYQYPEKLLPLCILHLLEGRSLPIYGDGTNVRDWLHVHDHCAGIERVIERGRDGESYNLGGDAERTNLDLVRSLCKLVDDRFAARPELAQRFPESPPARGEGCESRIRFVRDRPGHDRRYAIDASKARHELGFAPAYDLDQGLAVTLDWYLDHEAWWREVRERPDYSAWIGRHYGEPKG